MRERTRARGRGSASHSMARLPLACIFKWYACKIVHNQARARGLGGQENGVECRLCLALKSCVDGDGESRADPDPRGPATNGRGQSALAVVPCGHKCLCAKCAPLVVQHPSSLSPSARHRLPLFALAQSADSPRPRCMVCSFTRLPVSSCALLNTGPVPASRYRTAPCVGDRSNQSYRSSASDARAGAHTGTASA